MAGKRVLPLRPAGWPSATATYFACQAVARQVLGTATRKWLSERGFFDPEVDRRMRGKKKRVTS